MNLARHYRTLGLRRGATAHEVKTAYRQLVRQYHPDINPDAAAIEQFIEINDAYTAVVEALEAEAARKNNRKGLGLDSLSMNRIRLQLEKLGIGSGHESDNYVDISPVYEEGEPEVFGASISREDVEIANERIQTSQPVMSPSLSAREEALKQETYGQLKELLSQHKFPRAIALVEGLAHRMPNDSEVSQWQAIVYQRWGRMLILQGQPHKARIYLKKALRTDPNNQSLWSEVNRDFWHLASLGHQSRPAV